MSVPLSESRLRRGDYLVLVLACLVLFGYSLVGGRVLTGHESVQPEGAREMMADHDWIVPKCGGLPWLERPPLPEWIMVGIGQVCGGCDRDWVVRLAPVLMGTLVVLLAGWLGSVCYGRAVGLLGGLILATMWEFFCFASDPEADIFLCAVVTAAVALFVHLEFLRRPAGEGEPAGFLRSRPWPVLAFFVLFGMTNLAKGLIFGTLMVLVPVASFLLWNADFKALRRYIWLWGWLAFAAVALAWPVAAYLRYPDVTDLWFSDYAGRLNHGSFREPPWYYLVTLPYVLLPWTLVAVVGLWLTAARAFQKKSSPERFLWSWAVLTPAAFSVPDGKHHHYLVQCMVPWAVLAALGAVRLWQSIPQWPALLRNPLLSLVTLGLPGDVALAVFAHRIPGPSWAVPVLMVAWPAFALALSWFSAQRNGRLAIGGVFAVLAAAYCASYSYQTRYLDAYRDDMAFFRKAAALATGDRPLFVNFDTDRPLETFQLLFYGSGRTVLLHNLTFLADERIRDTEIYVMARSKDLAQLTRYGSAEAVLRSEHTRGEVTPADRRTLFRLRFLEGLPRKCAEVRVSPMQATHRREGPYLK